jgi:hypothetical protein
MFEGYPDPNEYFARNELPMGVIEVISACHRREYKIFET